MSKNKRILKGAMASLLTSSLIIGSMGLGFAQDFSDIEKHWAEKQVKQWVNRGIVSGYNDGTFKPDSPITRAEFVSLINKVYRFKSVYDIDYKDVSANDWYYEDFRKAKAEGYITGYQDNTIKPNNKITRQEVAVIISKVLHAQNNSKEEVANKFKDADKIASWSKGAIGTVVSLGYMKGYPDETFKPENNITRAEAIAALDKIYTVDSSSTLVEEKKKSSSSSSSSSSKNSDKKEDEKISGKGTIFEDKTVTGDLTITDDVKDGDVTLKNVTVKGETKIYGGGENTIRIKDSELKDVIIDKKNGKIRILLEGKTTVGKVKVKSGAILEEKDLKKDGFKDIEITDDVKDEKVTLKGDFDEIEVNAKEGEIIVEDGKITKLDINGKATDTEVEVKKDAKISKMTFSSKATVKGKGKIESVLVKSKGSTIEQDVEKVEVEKGYDITINGKKITETKETEKDTKAPEFKSNYPKAENAKEKSVDLMVKLNEAGKVYFIVVDAKDSKPSVSQVKAGKDYSGGKVIVHDTIKVDSADKEQKMGVQGLTANTNYKVYFVAEDSSKEVNLQKEVSSIEIKTAKEEVKTHDVTMVVKNEKDEPVKGASIKIDINGTEKTYKTDDKGKCKIEKVPVGKYDYTVECSGYEKVTEKDGIQVKEDGSTEVSVTLKAEEVKEEQK